MIKNYKSIFPQKFFINLITGRKFKEKRQFKENSFSGGAVKKILFLFNKLLSKRIHKPLFGSPDLYDIIQTKEGKFYTFEYAYGKGLSIRYKVKMGSSSNIDSIDFYFKPYSIYPTFTMKTNGLNLVQLLDIVANTILTGKTSEEAILENFKKKTKLKENIVKSVIDNLPKGKYTKGLAKYLILNPDGYDLETLFRSKKIDKNLLISYNAWANQNNELPYKWSDVFTNNIKTAILNSGIAKGAIVQVIPAKKSIEKILPTTIDIKIERMASFKGSVQDRFLEMEDYIEDVALNRAYSCIILGDPGIGKTYRCGKILKKNGYTEEETDPIIQYEVDDETGEEVTVMPKIDPNSYILVKGKVTPSALYQMLYMYNGALIVFDDSDEAMKGDPNLIKAATDDKPRRKLTSASAKTMSKKSPFPHSFLYVGRCIFITNLYAHQIDSAIMSRGNAIELDLTADEMVELCKEVTPTLVEETPGATLAYAQEVLDFLLANSDLFGKLDLRTYGQAIKERVRNSPDWKNRIGRKVLVKSKSLMGKNFGK